MPRSSTDNRPSLSERLHLQAVQRGSDAWSNYTNGNRKVARELIRGADEPVAAAVAFLRQGCTVGSMDDALRFLATFTEY